MMMKCLTWLSLIVLLLRATPLSADEPLKNAPKALQTIDQRLRELLKKELPAATVGSTDSELIARFDTQTFQIHGRSMDGRVTKEAHPEEGPNNKGILLRLSVQEGKKYDGQAVIPQTLRDPYWQTYINAYPVAGHDQHLWLAFEYGGRIDAKLVAKVNALILEATKN